MRQCDNATMRQSPIRPCNHTSHTSCGRRCRTVGSKAGLSSDGEACWDKAGSAVSFANGCNLPFHGSMGPWCHRAPWFFAWCLLVRRGRCIGGPLGSWGLGSLCSMVAALCPSAPMPQCWYQCALALWQRQPIWQLAR